MRIKCTHAVEIKKEVWKAHLGLIDTNKSTISLLTNYGNLMLLRLVKLVSYYRCTNRY